MKSLFFKKFNLTLGIKIFVGILLLTFVLVPLGFMLGSLGSINIGEILGSQKFLLALLNSFVSTSISTVLSVFIGFILAYAISRSHIKYKGLIAVLLTVPMLIPSIAHGMGLVVLFGNNGIITNFFGGASSIYGMGGVILGSIMYSFPTAYLMFSDVFKYEDRSIYEVADIMGISKARQFLNLTLPYLKKPLISICFAVFVLILTDYGVPMMVGGRYMTLPLYMYNEVIGQTNFGIGALVAIVLLVPAVAACLFDLFNKDASNQNFGSKDIECKKTKLLDISTYILCGVTILLILLPIVIFSVIGFITKYPTDITLGFSNLITAFNMNAGNYLLNSLFIAFLVGIIGTAFAFFTAYLTSRTEKVGSTTLHLLSVLSLAIPGVVLGISYSLMYGGTIFIGTIAILVLVNTVHFFASPYLLCYNAMNKVNKNYEVVAKTLHINKYHFIQDILFPETFDTVLEMFSYFFVNSMVTISAVSFVQSAMSTPLSLLINQFETQMLLECSAIVSLIILIFNGLMKGVIYIIKRERGKNNAK